MNSKKTALIRLIRMKKNYLFPVLVTIGIVGGIALGATALAINSNQKQIKSSKSSHQELGAAAALYGGFKSTLSDADQTAFYQTLGFNRNGELSIKTANAGSKKVRLFEFAKYDATAIGLTRNVMGDLVITDQIFQQANMIADLDFKLTLKRNLVTDFIIRKAVAKLTPHAKPTIVYSFKPDRINNNGQSVAFTPTHFITAKANLSSVILQQLGIENQVNHLIYFAKNTGIANTSGTNADYALILDTKTGQLNLWTKAKLQHPLKLQVYYQTPIIQNPQLLKELDTTREPYQHPETIASLLNASIEDANKDLDRSMAKFWIKRNGLKSTLKSSQLQKFLSDINQNLDTSQKLLSVNLGNDGTDITTYADASGASHASKAKKYGIMAGLKPNLILKYLTKLGGREQLYTAVFGKNFSDFDRTILNAVFDKGLTVNLKLTVALTNTDPAKSKRLIGKKSAFELLLTWNTLTNRYSFTMLELKNVLIPTANVHTKVTGIGGEGEPIASDFAGFAFGVGGYNAINVPAVEAFEDEAAKIYILINTKTGILWTETKNAGLTSNDKLTFKFEFDSVIINKQ